MKKPKFPVYISGERIFSNSQKAINLQDKSNLGELKEGKVIYSQFEALYLVEKKEAIIVSIKKGKELSENEIITLFSKKEKEFHTKYIIFKYLKNKGYIVKTGLKFGEEFRVYKKHDKHARWIVFPVSSNEKIQPKELISKSRVTHSTGKKLLLAIVDSEEDITFYEIDWVKP
jgi:tRNA-intron endonuclease, archaea type